MRKQSESTLKMKAEFLKLKEQGYTNSQIAKKYNCAMPTVYRVIDAIVQETGMPKEKLLDKRSHSSKKVNNQAVKTERQAHRQTHDLNPDEAKMQHLNAYLQDLLLHTFLPIEDYKSLQ